MGGFGTNFGTNFAGQATSGAAIPPATKTVKADLCVITGTKNDLCVTESVKEDLCV